MALTDRNPIGSQKQPKTMGGHTFWDNIVKSGRFRLQKHKFAPLFRILDDGDYLQAIGEEGAMRARLRLLTAGNSYIVPQCGDIVGIHNVDPSQITLARWERFCFAMGDLAKRRGWE